MKQIKVVDGLPKSGRHRLYSQIELDHARNNNKFLIRGTNPVFPGALTSDHDIIVFLEYVQSSTTFTISGIDGDTVVILTDSIVSPMDLTHAPLRLDGGVLLTGTILIATGFYLIVKN